MSGRVSWETCPRCGRSAAVAWRSGTLVQVDCPGGCPLTAVDFARQASSHGPFHFPQLAGRP